MKRSFLLGLAIGDALGAPFETAKAEEERLRLWTGEFLPSRGGYHDLDAGQWTDDTQMSVALAKVLLSRRQYDAEAVAAAYLEWFQSGKARGIGGTIRAAMQNLASGAPWTESGVKGSEGNGTAMRAAPIGAAVKDIVRVGPIARLDAQITHASTEAEEGSAAIALSVAFLMTGMPKADLPRFLQGWLRDSQVKAGIGDAVGMDLAGAATRYAASSQVWSIVPLAVACFVGTASYEAAVTAAIKAGGDTDTCAAMTGAMAGTFYGRDAIPERLLRDLEDVQELTGLEDAILGA